MKVRVTAQTAGIRRKQKALVQAARGELRPTCAAAMQMFVKEAALFTPPASKHDGNVVEGVKRLKARVAQDLAGDGQEVDGEMRWITVNGQPKLVFRDKTKLARQPSPFVQVRKIDDKVKEAHHVGKYKVEATEDPDKYMKMRPYRYYLKRRAGKGAAHLRWNGARVIALARGVKAAIRKRQKRAGTLMSGWNALAGQVGAKLPASIQRLHGRGACEERKMSADRVAISGRNRADVHHIGLDGILDKRRKQIDRTIRRKLKARAEIIRRKLKATSKK
ncbi:MAG: hypothetical protein Q3986_06565 [Akkermansia sp.]|nr:hypothetical protein [Akkermansia sp.]